jgi:transposase-like protein
MTDHQKSPDVECNLYPAIDQFDQVIDVLVSEKLDWAATRRFFTQAFEHGPARRLR